MTDSNQSYELLKYLADHEPLLFKTLLKTQLGSETLFGYMKKIIENNPKLDQQERKLFYQACSYFP